MNLLKLIKHIFFFFLTILLGTQTTYAKTELVLLEKNSSFFTEKIQSYYSQSLPNKTDYGFFRIKNNEIAIVKNRGNVNNLANTVANNLLASVRNRFSGIQSSSWFDDASEAVLQQLDELPDNYVDDFIQDINNSINKVENASPNFHDFIKSNKGGVSAWKKVTGRAYSTDVPFLENLSDIMEQSVLNKLRNGEADLDGIIAALVHPHSGASHTFKKQAAEHLDDVKHLVNNFNDVEGFNKVITTLKTPNFFAQDGASLSSNLWIRPQFES